MKLQLRCCLFLGVVVSASLFSCGTTAQSCSATNCAGCCTTDKTCVTVQTTAQCGSNGFSCVACQGGTTCVSGSCTFSGSGGGAGGGGGSGTGLRVFGTSIAYQSDLKTLGGGTTGLDGADRLCNQAAQAANKGGVWVAWLSTDTVNALSRVTAAGPWSQQKPNGELVRTFNNKANLGTGPLTPIVLDENGTDLTLGGTVTGITYWTGTRIGGVNSTFNCGGWETTADSCTFGRPTSGNWTDDGRSQGNAMIRALMCFEQ